jgi:hypothetical protein
MSGRRGWVTFVLFALATSALAQTPDDLARAKLLIAEDPARAVQYLASVRERAAAPDTSFDLAFLEGVAAQRAATEMPSDARFLEQAEAAYARAAALRPDSAAAAFNQGVLAQQRGDLETALAAFTRSVELARVQKDARLPAYQLKLAEAAAPSQPESALRALEEVLAAAPQDPRASTLFERIASARAPSALVARGARSLAAGDVAAAERAALTLLETPLLADAIRFDALRLLAAAWTVTGSQLLEARSGRAQAALALHELHACAGELAAAFTGSPKPANCWRADAQVSPALGRNGRTLFRELLRERARQLASAPEARSVEAAALFEQAIPLGEHGPDPDAFLELTSLHAREGRPAKIHELMERYGAELFSEKSYAYSRGDYALVHRMHLALGLSYAALGVWESDSFFQNAFFQLDAAMRSAERFNRSAPPGTTQLAAPVAAVEALSDAHAERGRLDQAIRVRVEGAKALQRAGRVREERILVDNERLKQLQKSQLQERIDG